MMVLAADPAQDRHRFVEVADNQVGTAIVVQVAEADAPAQVVLLVIAANLPADVLELAAEVAIQHGRLLAADRFARMKVDDMTVGDEQVLPAIQIQVEEGGAPTDVALALFAKAGLHRLVVE